MYRGRGGRSQRADSMSKHAGITAAPIDQPIVLMTKYVVLRSGWSRFTALTIHVSRPCATHVGSTIAYFRASDVIDDGPVEYRTTLHCRMGFVTLTTSNFTSSLNEVSLSILT